MGREAFRGNRQLVRVDLPESLERIGERAFLDTSIGTLRLAAGVREIGEDALLVQGEMCIRDSCQSACMKYGTVDELAEKAKEMPRTWIYVPEQ